MKSVIWPQYGPPEVLSIGEVEKPVPGDNDVIIKIHASTITAGDCEMRRFQIPPLFWLPLRLYLGFFKPSFKQLGQEFAGVIDSVGKNVKNYKTGDRIYGITTVKMGAHAEYIKFPGNYRLPKIPAKWNFSEATTLPVGAVNAVCFIRLMKLKPGKTLLIVGAGGSIGTYTIQIAKNLGAEITAVDSVIKHDMLVSIGADHIIDYKTEDYTKNGLKYDIILDVANKAPFFASVRSLNPGGRLILTNPSLSGLLYSLWIRLTTSKRVLTGLAANTWSDYKEIEQLAGQGIIKPVIDRYFTLDQIIEAHHYVDEGLKKGNAIVTIVSSADSAN